jgi:hypothetical protein
MSATVDEPAPADLERAIHEARFFDLPGRPAAPTRGADRMQYSITVVDGSRTHTVTVSDGAIPESLQPVVEYLSMAAGARGARGR